MKIRPLDPAVAAELDWVMHGMRATLIEVEGEAQGTALYTLGWLRERARWHTGHPDRAVLLAEAADGTILGHTILRCETDACGAGYGLISTTYVAPAARRQGLGLSLLDAGESWMRERGLSRSATWTSATNTRLVGLYAKRGYLTVATHAHETTGTSMIRLQRELS